MDSHEDSIAEIEQVLTNTEKNTYYPPTKNVEFIFGYAINR